MMTHKRGSIENILLMVTLLVLILGIVITTNSNDFSSVNNLLTGAAIGISEPNEDLGLELINETEVLESAVALPENFLVGDTENIIEQPTEDISEETIEGTIELPSEETTEEIIELPSEEIIEEPEEITEEVIELPVDLPIEEPAEVIEQPTEEIIEEPVEPIVEKPIEEPEEQPIGNELTGGLVVDLPVENISDEIVELPVEELLLVNETVEIPINESIPEIIGINETNDNITLDVINETIENNTLGLADDLIIQADSTNPATTFILPTSNNGSSTTNTSVEINISIVELNLSSLIYNWNGTNFTMYNNSLVLMYNFDTITESINATFTMSDSGNSYHYEDITSISDYVLQSGDYVEYDVLWTGSNDRIAFDYTTSDASNLRDSGAADQNSLSPHPNTDLSIYSLNQWYHRKIAIVGGHVGKTIQNYDLVCESDSAGTYTGYLDNILITDGAGTTRKLIYTNGSFTHAQHISNLGALTVLVNTTTGPQRTSDVSVNGNDGTANGSTWNSSGKYGGGFEFDGINDYIIADSVCSDLNSPTEMSFGCWIKPKIGSSTGYFLSFNDNDNSNNIQLGYQTDREFKFYDGSVTTPVATFTENVWYHIIVTINSSNNVTIYVNGINNATTTTAVRPASNAKFSIGQEWDGGGASNFFNGTIDELRIWNRSLSASEVYQQYISNLNKFNSTQWYLYVNQSKNATTNLSLGNYTYQAFATDGSGNINSTEERTIKISSATPAAAAISSLSLDLIYPTLSINVSQHQWFNVSVNVSCFDADCGEVNVSLDPASTTVYNFTTCGTSGKDGPNQSQCDTNYTGTTLAGLVTVGAGIQNWTVPTTGTYTIETFGASGGDGTYIPGNGTRMKGDFSLTAGTVLSILVGQKGSTNGGEAGGGGGGTFVWNPANTIEPLIVAGGGGGTGDSPYGNGVDAVTSVNGTKDSHDVYAGGVNGEGGTSGNPPGAGAGWKSDGADGAANTGGHMPLNGGMGGDKITDGGFGGGGADGDASTGSDSEGGGGGGGYSGGAASDSSSDAGGGGGGSYNSGTNQNNSVRTVLGDGLVSITSTSSAKSGLVSMNISATPFYTNTTNPYNLTLNQGESQVITWWVNGTGSIDTAYEFFAYVNQTSNMSISNITSVWNVTILDVVAPQINITYPLNTTYSTQMSGINYTYSDINGGGNCWYSTNNGTTNSSTVSAGINFTEPSGVAGTNYWTLYCNDSSGNLNNASVEFILDIPSISIDWVRPTSNVNITQNEIAEFIVSITCSNNDCGEINATLTSTGGGYESCQAALNSGQTDDGVYSICPIDDCFDVYCDMTNGGFASIFQVDGNLTLNNTGCRFSFSNDDHDSYTMWQDYSLQLATANIDVTNSQQWYVWNRDNSTNTTAGYLPDRISGQGANARPVPLPAVNKTIWFDWQNTRIMWDTYNVTFASVGIASNGGFNSENNNFYFITDGINQIHTGYSGGSAVVLTFDFVNNNISNQTATVLNPTGGWWGTEEDTFGHILWTVNGRVMYYKSSGVFVLGGNLTDPNTGVTDFPAVIQPASPSQPGIDFFGQVDENGSLWLVDWGHDSGGYFACGSDSSLGVGQTNIVLVPESSSGQSSSGPVSTDTSTTPFYTTTQNPYTFSLNESQSQQIIWYVNATGELDSTNELFAFVNLTSDLSISDDTAAFNFTIVNFSVSPISISYPSSGNHITNVSQINYTLQAGYGLDQCWASVNSGVTNTTKVSAGTNFTDLVSVAGSNTWTIYCNSTDSLDYSRSVTFQKIPLIGLTQVSPTSSINATQNETFYVSTTVSCSNVDCGEINVSLDPASSTVYNFTNCGKIGYAGPSQGDCDTVYSGTTLAELVTVGGGIQNWTVPSTGTYIIEASGAQGGKKGSNEGGLGAQMIGTFSLTEGEIIQILVGQEGIENTQTAGSYGSAGGGGGTFVVRSTENQLLIAAGGGGGSGDSTVRSHATNETTGVNGNTGNTVGNGGTGGTNGGGGQSVSYGGGGAGWVTSGLTGTYGKPGTRFLDGGLGGWSQGGNDDIASSDSSGKNGGFGGGAGSYAGGGGGGGYSGGGGGKYSPAGGGGGGGSYNNGTDQTNTAAFNTADGYVSITSTSSAKSGLVSMNTSATPFYTTTQNPYNVSLNAGESQTIIWTVNSTGEIDSAHDFFVYANWTSDKSISDVTDHWNVTIVNFSVSPISIVYPTGGNYFTDVTAINYTLSAGHDLHTCWYSTDGGSTYSANVSTGVNFTDLSSAVGSNTWIVYCNDSNEVTTSRSVAFSKLPTIGLTLLSPLTDVNVTQNQTFTISATVSCNNFDCGAINVTLDPVGTPLSCKELLSQGNTIDGEYIIYPDGVTPISVYCDMTRNDGGWTLFANMNYGNCAESLTFGNNNLTSPTSGQYFSKSLSGFNHTEMMVVLNDTGGYKFDYIMNLSNKNLSQRFIDFVGGGEAVTWTARDGVNDYTGVVDSYKFSDGAGLTSSSWGTRTTLSADDGTWGVANATNLDGNGGLYLSGTTGSFGFENANSGDTTCNGYFINGAKTSSTTWVANAYIRESTVYAASSKSGLISMNTSATPFYTTTQNPYNLSLNAGESETITWTVNATGTINSTHDFFVYLNWTTDPSISNSTDHWNITIRRNGTYTGVDATAPVITFVLSNNTYSSDNNLDIDYTISELNLSSCWYSNDTMTSNISLGSNGNCANITSVTWTEGQHNVIVWASDSSGNNGSSSLTFTIDTTNPNGTLMTPGNNTYNTTTNTQNFTVNLSDNIGVKNATLYVYNSSGNLISEITNSFLENVLTPTLGTVVDLADGVYNWFYKLFDWAGNSFATSNFTVTVDATTPLITIISPANNTYTTDTTLDINYTVYDFNLSSCWYSNDTMTSNISLGSGDNCINITNINWTEGNHNLTIWVNDSGRYVNSSTITFTIDKIDPYATLVSPENNTYNTPAAQNYTVNLSDNIGIKNATFYIYNSSGGLANQTTDINFVEHILSSTSGIDVTLADDTYTWHYDVSDWAGNNYLSINNTIIIDATAPVLNVTSFTNNTYTINTGLDINYTVSDTYLDSCWYSNDTMSVNTTLASCANITTITWPEGQHNITIWANDSAGNENSILRRFTIDLTNPNATLNTPENNTYVSASTQNFTVNLTDNIGVKNVTLYIYNSSSTLTNQTATNFSEYTLSSYFGTVVILADDNYTWSYSVFDWAGNNLLTSNYTVIVDTTNPFINVAFPSNNTYTDNTGLDINYTVSDTNLDSCWYSNDTMSVNTTLASCANITTVTWSEGQHNVTVWTNDSVNHLNSSSITFMIDSIYPSININSPDNNSYTDNIGLDINYTVSDTNLDSCWYSNDTMSVNTTLASCANITSITWSEGNHNVTVWVNDSAGNENSSSVTFTIDTIYPSINITSPLNGTFLSDVGTDINYTVSDTNLDSCWYSNDTMTSNTTLASCANITSVTWSEGQHNVTIWVNDSVNHINSSSVSFTIESASIGLDWIYPTSNINVTQNQFFNVTVNVSCSNANCGEINVSLDPVAGNIKLNATLSASSSFSGYPPSEAVNGILGDGDGWLSSDTSMPQWLQFDFDTNYTLVNLTIYQEEETTVSIMDNFSVEYNNSGSWEVAFWSDYNSDELNKTYLFPSITTDSIRVHVYEGKENNYAFIEEININGYSSENKGLISMVSGTTPFYTNITNPYNLSLNENESQVITWWVNATGTVDNNYEFFVYANKTSNQQINNITSKLNITITSTSDNVYPSFSNYWDDNATLTNSGLGQFNVTVTNTNGTVLLEINSENITATNSTATVFNASYNFTSSGNYSYKWHSWGNGSNNNHNVSDTRTYVVNNYTADLTAPTFTGISNVTIEVGNALGYDINATDTNGVSCFTVNDTTNFKINCSGYLENNTVLEVALYNLNITINDTSNNNNSAIMWVNVTNLDTTYPTWSGNKTNLTTNTSLGSSVYFNVTLSDAKPDQYIFSWYNGTDWINDFATSYTNGQEVSVNKTLNINDGNINWTWYFNDTSGNDVQTDVWNIVIDTVNPTISFESQTTASGNYSQSHITANITSSDTNLNNITINLYNSISLYNSTTQSSSPFYLNFTSLSDDTYYLNSTACDSYNNCNSTSTRTILLDTAYPTWSGNKTNLTTNTSLGNLVYFNITLSESNPDQYIFSWYNGTAWVNDSAISYTNGQNISVTKTINTKNVDINWTWYFNDTYGNSNQTDTWNVVLYTTPTISLSTIYPLANINVSQNEWFNVTVNITCNGNDCGAINVSLDPEDGAVGNGTMGSYDNNYITLTGTGATSNHFAWTFDQNGDIWTYAWSGGPLYKFNGTTGAYIKTVTLADNTNYGYCLQLAVDLDGRMYCSAYTHDKITVFWPENGTGITTHALASTDNAGGVYFDGKYIWYGQDMSSGGNKYSRVDVTDGGWDVINEFDVGFSSDGYGMGVVGDTLFISASTGDNWHYYADLNFTDNSTSASYTTTSSQGVSNVISFNFNGSYMMRGAYSSGIIRAYQTGEISCLDTTQCILLQGGCVGSGTSFDWDGDGTEETCNSGTWSSSSVKSGLISMNTSATPFYTNVTNPYNVSLSEDESQIITWHVNATGEIDTPYEFFVYANKTADLSINNITSKWNVTIRDTTAPTIDITYPLSVTYDVNVIRLDYTYSDSNDEGSCWYSNSSGVWNSTSVVAGINFTNVITTEGENNFVLYCNDSSGNSNTDTVTFTKNIPQIGLSLVSPTTNLNTFQNDFFDVIVNVSCSNNDCGEINVSLDPPTDRTPRTCSGVWGASCEGADPSTSDYSYDSCSPGSYYSTGFWVDEVTVDATTVAIGDTINITCNYDCYSSSSLNDLAIMYYNGTWNKIWRQDSACTDGDYSVSVNVSGDLGQQYARCSIGYNNYPNDASDDTCFDTTYSDNDDVNFTVIAAGKNGLVSMVVGDTPFYTNVTNPYNLTLNENESQLITWHVNATGDLNSTHEFFVYVNKTADLSISNITKTINVTIVSLDLPTINFVSPTTSSESLSQNYVAANISAGETNFVNLTIYLYNSSGLYNYSNSSSSEYYVVFSNLPDGTYYLNATTVNTFGTENNAKTRTITLDTIAPLLEVTSPVDGYNLSSNTLEFTFVATESSTTNCSIFSDQEGSISYVLRDSNSSITSGITTTLNISNFEVRSHSWYITCTDSVGNSNTSSTRQFTVDNSAPSIILSSPTEDSSAGSIVYIYTEITDSLTAIDQVSYTIYNGSALGQSLVTGSLNLSNNWDATWNSSSYGEVQMNLTLVISANDTGGNLASENVTFYLDNVNPVIQLIEPSELLTYYKTNFSLNAIVQDLSLNYTNYSIRSNSVVQQNFSSYGTPVISHTWNDLVNVTGLSEGPYNLTVFGKDISSNSRIVSTLFIIDRTAPQLTLHNPSGIYSNSNSVLFNFTVVDNISSTLECNISIGGNTPTIYCLNSSSCDYTFTGFSDLLYNYSLFCQDNASNVVGYSSNITIDTTSPQIVFNSQTSSGNLSQNYLVINVSVVDQNLASISNNFYNLAGSLINTSSSSSTPFFVNLTGLSSGTYYFNSTATDLAGNIMSTATRTVILDVIIPTNSLSANSTNLQKNVDSVIINWSVSDNNINIIPSSLDPNQVSLSDSSESYGDAIIVTDGSSTDNLNTVIFNITSPNGALLFKSSERSGEIVFTPDNLTSMGTYLASLYSVDNAGNQNSTNLTVLVNDTTVPTVNLINPLSGNYAQNWIFVNITSTDEDVNSITIYLYNNIQNLVEQDGGFSSPYNYNFTSLDDGTYYYNVTVCDSNQCNSSETKTVLLDTTGPETTLNYPESDYVNSSSNIVNVLFNCSAADSLGLINISLYITNNQNIAFTFNQSANISGTSNSTTWNLNLSPGNHTWNCLGTDILGNSLFALGNKTVFINFTDTDNDGTKDEEDLLEGNESNVIKSGIGKLNISVGRNSTFGTYNDVRELIFSDLGIKMINFTHNFTASQLDLSKITIIKNANYLIVNLSQQLQSSYNKTLYLENNEFISLCVKDAEINSISEVSSSCNGANETDLTDCLTTNITLGFDNTTNTTNLIGCDYDGNIFTVTNLQYSAIKGTVATPASADAPAGVGGAGGGGGGGGGGGSAGAAAAAKIIECYTDADCDSEKTCYQNRCVKLFDAKIIDVASPIGDDGYLDFTYFIKGMANINSDVIVNFWLEKDGQRVSSGQDVIYLGSFEEKTEQTKIFVPQDLTAGAYEFYVQVSLENYAATAHRTVYVEQGEQGREVSIGDSLVGKAFGFGLGGAVGDYNFVWLSLIIMLFIAFMVIIFHRNRTKLKQVERWIKQHKLLILAPLSFIILVISIILIWTSTSVSEGKINILPIIYNVLYIIAIFIFVLGLISLIKRMLKSKSSKKVVIEPSRLKIIFNFLRRRRQEKEQIRIKKIREKRMLFADKEQMKQEARRKHRKFFHDYFGMFKTEKEKEEINRAKLQKIARKRIEEIRKQEEKLREQNKAKAEKRRKQEERLREENKARAEKLRKDRKVISEERNIIADEGRRKQEAKRSHHKFFHDHFGMFKTDQEKAAIRRAKEQKIARKQNEKRNKQEEKLRERNNALAKKSREKRKAISEERNIFADEKRRKQEVIRNHRKFFHDNFGMFKTNQEKVEIKRAKERKIAQKRNEKRRKQEKKLQERNNALAKKSRERRERLAKKKYIKDAIQRRKQEIKRNRRKFFHDTFGLFKTEKEKEEISRAKEQKIAKERRINELKRKQREEKRIRKQEDARQKILVKEKLKQFEEKKKEESKVKEEIEKVKSITAQKRKALIEEERIAHQKLEAIREEQRRKRQMEEKIEEERLKELKEREKIKKEIEREKERIIKKKLKER